MYIGERFYRGNNDTNTPKDIHKAISWFQKAADQGQAHAQYMLGWIYEYGEGGTKDYAAAYKWYSRAANQNNPGAYSQLGELLYRGRGIERDYQKAMLMFVRAAELGDPHAHYMLGFMYRYGQGVEADLRQAKRWFSKAVKLGDIGSQDELNKIGDINNYAIPSKQIADLTWLSSTGICSKQMYMLNIGVKSESQIGDINIVVNGENYRGIHAVTNDGYDMKVKQEIKLKNGSNEIRVDVMNSAGVASISKSIIYQSPNPIQIDNSNKRLALVIGNAKYVDRPLANPSNDAQDIASKLKTLGFDVMTLVDGNLEQMEKSISSFATKAAAYDVALFYYAGHGIQYEGDNYLIPVNGGITDETQLRYKCTNVGFVLDLLEKSNCKMKIIVLDACRDNPFKKSSSRSIGNCGLSIMTAPVGTLIAYATSPNDVARDGQGRNSPYTSSFLQALNTPGLKIYDLFQQISESVSAKTNDAQRPWFSSSLSNANFYFNAIQ